MLRKGSSPYALLHRAPSGDSQTVAPKERQSHFSDDNVFQGRDNPSQTITTQVEEITCPIRDARTKEIVERQRNGTWDGIPRGFSLVEDGDGIERLKRITKDGRADKSKDIGKSEEDTALFNLGGTNAASNKSGSDDDGLGQELDDLLNGMEVNPNGKGNVTPLRPEMGDEDDPNNAVSYSDEEDILAGLSGNENNQSKDKQRNNQPLGTEEQQT